jgi:ceramide glucosyltransferase
LPWALLVLLLAHCVGWAWGLLDITLAMRVGVAMVVGKWVLRDRQVIRSLAFIPLRDVLALVVWIVSFAGHEVGWRGDRFRLKNGKLVRIES